MSNNNKPTFVVDEWMAISEARKWLISEGLNDPGIFKAVFMAGSPGAGKSTVNSALAFKTMGLRTINSDQAFEQNLKKAGLPQVSTEVDPKVWNVLRGKAKITTRNMKELTVEGRLGVVIDGTASDPEKIVKMKKLLEAIGYETKMIFVSTDLQTALDRNKHRGEIGGRSVPEEIIKDKFKDIQKGQKKLQSVFGSKNFIEIDNSGSIEELDKKVVKSFVKLKAWANKLPKNKHVAKWIELRKKIRGLR